jgi:hypothetical protein
MSDREPRQTGPETDPEADREDAPDQGPNLVLIYSLIALALAAAIGFAMMIVLPFFHRR